MEKTPNVKISLITVVYNARHTIERCIRSVLNQDIKDLQYIIIDGGSSDGSVELIGKYLEKISVFISEPDAGIYDAMNKGISHATGDIIGILNADDCFADHDVLQGVVDAFSDPVVTIAYGDLDFVDAEGNTVRRWRSGAYQTGKFNRGWMPPHPTFYCRSGLFELMGFYKLEYGSAADYELMLRFMHGQPVRVRYIQKVMIQMETGGISNKSLRNRLAAMRNDLKAMRHNHVRLPFITILLKPLRKLTQFF